MLEGTKLGSVNTCGLVWSTVQRESGTAWEQDKGGMCEQIQRQGSGRASLVKARGSKLSAERQGNLERGDVRGQRGRKAGQLQQYMHLG